MNSTRNLAGRPAKMLSRFPSFVRADRPGKVLSEIALVLGGELDEAERLLASIQRSHRLPVAETEHDVLRLAALLGLQRADFLLIRKFYEAGLFTVEEAGSDQEREDRTYTAYLNELKESVERVVRVMLEGCGTLWALLEGTSILIGAETVAGPGDRLEHPDAGLPRGGFIHRITADFRAVENDRIVTRRGAIYLLENPLKDKASDDAERRQRERFPVSRRGLFDVAVAVQVTGVEQRTAQPLVINETRHEGVGFRGVLTSGQRLFFAISGKVFLDGTDVTDRCLFMHGALFQDSGRVGPAGSTFVASPAQAGIVRKDRFSHVHPAGALDRNFPRPAITPLASLPVHILALGDTSWRFCVQDGAYDASAFNEAVFALPDDLASLAALPASGKVQLQWREHEPFAATVLIPSELKLIEQRFLKGADRADAGWEENLPTLVRAGLERFRPAGVRLNVDYYDREWVLGKSVLKDLDATAGEGVDFGGTVVARSPA